MAISSCLKTKVNGNASKISSFYNSDFDPALNAVSGSSIDDLIVFAHLNNFFDGFTEWFYVMPMVQSTGNLVNPLIGQVADSELLVGHPVKSLSLACFTKQTVKDAVASNVPRSGFDEVMPADLWQLLVKNTDFGNLNQLIIANSPDGVANMTVIDNRTTLKIMRCTQADIKGLGGNSDFPAYVDAFDIVKEKLVNNVALLNSAGLAPAVYHADGDYIEFVADCSIEFANTFPELLPIPT